MLIVARIERRWKRFDRVYKLNFVVTYLLYTTLYADVLLKRALTKHRHNVCNANTYRPIVKRALV